MYREDRCSCGTLIDVYHVGGTYPSDKYFDKDGRLSDGAEKKIIPFGCSKCKNNSKEIEKKLSKLEKK